MKLGLVPFGDIRPMDADCATLTFNNIGRHQSTLVRTRVASTMSPWMSRMEVGEMHTVAISHGEGRFVAPQPLLDSMIANGQVATQYVDAAGQPPGFGVNPNGVGARHRGHHEPDGHVLGKDGSHGTRRRGPVQEHLRQHLPAPLRRRCRLLPHEVVTATRGSCRCMRWLLGRVACDRRRWDGGLMPENNKGDVRNGSLVPGVALFAANLRSLASNGAKFGSLVPCLGQIAKFGT